MPVKRDPKSTHLESRVKARYVRVYCLTANCPLTGFKRVMHGVAAGSDMRVFLAEYWFKDCNEGRLKYNIKTCDFNLAKDLPSLHEWTSGSPFHSSFAGMLEVQKNH